MKMKKLSVKALMFLILSAILFCMPVGAFFANRANTVEVHEEDTAEQKTESAAEESSAESTASGNDNKQFFAKPEPPFQALSITPMIPPAA